MHEFSQYYNINVFESRMNILSKHLSNHRFNILVFQVLLPIHLDDARINERKHQASF